ncbi:hypothetical protein [Salipaludibacillus sp. CF4.18]|uniref:hypothetical protein n=1 Tax=Salipaludibacillus sp. CF4.18 TaxID=3373081 RepID=UPI003EE60212
MNDQIAKKIASELKLIRIALENFTGTGQNVDKEMDQYEEHSRPQANDRVTIR